MKRDEVSRVFKVYLGNWEALLNFTYAYFLSTNSQFPKYTFVRIVLVVCQSVPVVVRLAGLMPLEDAKAEAILR